MIEFSNIQLDSIQRVMNGTPPRLAACGSTWKTIHEKMGVSNRDEVGTWGMWIETIAWVISYRPDLIPPDSVLGKALERRGQSCGMYERLGRAVEVAVEVAAREDRSGQGFTPMTRSRAASLKATGLVRSKQPDSVRGALGQSDA